MKTKVQVSRILLRAAIEDAAERAAQAELTRQIQPQVGGTVFVERGPIHLHSITYDSDDWGGVTVEWVD